MKMSTPMRFGQWKPCRFQHITSKHYEYRTSSPKGETTPETKRSQALLALGLCMATKHSKHYFLDSNKILTISKKSRGQTRIGCVKPISKANHGLPFYILVSNMSIGRYIFFRQVSNFDNLIIWVLKTRRDEAELLFFKGSLGPCSSMLRL